MKHWNFSFDLSLCLENQLLSLVLLITIAYSVALIQIHKEYTTEKNKFYASPQKYANVYFSHTLQNIFVIYIFLYALLYD